jgi:hypothetical protein
MTREWHRSRRGGRGRSAWIPVVIGLLIAVFPAVFFETPAEAAPTTITSINFSPDNVFDNALVAAGSDSGSYISVSLAAGAVENPDLEGGLRVEVYDKTTGELVRRRSSENINGTTSASRRWNGQGDTNINDTLPYGSYTVRAYASMLNPTVVRQIVGSGIVIDRPGDVYVDSNGVLTWTNTGKEHSIIQVSLGDPIVQAPTFLRRVLLDDYFTLSADVDNSSWGVVANTKGEIFVCIDDGVGGADIQGIAKYSTATETWIAENWYAPADVTDAFGLGIDQFDSIYISTRRDGGGNQVEGVIKIRDNGATATRIFAVDEGLDYWDIAPSVDGTVLYTTDDNSDELDKRRGSDGVISDNDWLGNPNNPRGIWCTQGESDVYFCDNTDEVTKRDGPTGADVYTIGSPLLDGVASVTVWRKMTTGETFVIVSAQNTNTIAIYKENALGDSATLVRTIEDDPYNLDGPVDIGVTPDSNLYVACQGSNSIRSFDKTGVFVEFTNTVNGKKFIQGVDVTALLTDTTGFRNIMAMDVDETGNVYVIDQYEFDNEDGGNERSTVLKRFNPDGSPNGNPVDIDDISVPMNGYNSAVNMAIWANNSLYVASNENQARVLRMNSNGDSIGGLGSLFPRDASTDVYSLKSGPYFDRSANRFYPNAIFCFLNDETMDVFTEDLKTQLVTAKSFDYGAYPNNASTQTWPFVVDNSGEMYSFDQNEDIQRYSFETPEADILDSAVWEYSGFGSGAPPPTTDFNNPTDMVWVDAYGIYTKNAITQRYETLAWLLDKNNNRMVQMLLEWNDVEEQTLTIAFAQDTPLVSSATITAETIATVGGITYVGAGRCTVAIDFTKQMNTAANPDTLQIQIKPTDGAFGPVSQVSYAGTTWTGTRTITAWNGTSGDKDGSCEIQVMDAYDLDSPPPSGRLFIDPNPDQTDFDLGDGFKPFVIDNTPPVMSISAPAGLGADSPAAATYDVTGTVLEEVTGKDATIIVYNWTALSGGIQFDTASGPAAADGTFTGTVDLRTPAPSSNYIEVIAIDRLGNRTTLTPRRLVERVKNVGNAYITPSTETIVNSPRYYRIIYTAAQVLVGDSLRITIPNAWSQPQKLSATTAGYVTIVETGAGIYTDSNFSGQVITILGLSRPIGGTLTIVYGDSSAGAADGMARSTVDAPLDNGSNTFQAALMQAGETTFTAVSAPTGLSLIVPLRDSALSVAVRDTGPGTAPPPKGDSIEVAKGSDTKVLTVRFYNTNIGAHTNRVTGISLTVESDTGSPVFWSNVASRVVLKNTTEGVTFADVTTLPGSQNLAITPSSLTIDQGQWRDVEFWVTFSPSATVDTARFSFVGTSAFTAVDNVSNKTLSVLAQETGVANLKTGEYDIVGYAPADTLFVSTDTSITPADVSTRQKSIRVMDVSFRNEPPHPDTPVNSVRVDQIIFSIRLDTSGNGCTPVHVISGIRIKDAFSGVTYGGVDTPALPYTGDTVVISLSGLTVTSGATVDAQVFVDIVNDTVSYDSFRVRLDSTSQVVAKDQVTQFSVKVKDDPADPDSFRFQTRAIRIIRRGRINIASWTLMRTDSSIINHANGKTLVVGSQFFVAVRCTANANMGAVRVIPADTDLTFMIGGASVTSEFTVSAPAARTIGAGTEDTITYSVVQNNGTSNNVLTIQFSDTGTGSSADTRARFFDSHDYTEPDVVRAEYKLPILTDSVTLTATPLDVFSLTLDTTYANAAETGVPVLFFRVRNNQGSIRRLDSVVIEAISPDSAIKFVRFYHSDTTPAFRPSVTATPAFGFDSLVGTGTLQYSDSACTIILSSPVNIAGSSASESFYVAFDFEERVTDGDTFDARLPASGLRCTVDTFFPTSPVNSTGEGRVEVVATRLTITPDTQIVAVGSSPNITLKAVDAYDNLDNIINYESSTQGRNVQVQVTVSDAVPATDTRFSITATSGMTGVTPAPAATGITSINGSLSNGQGQVTIRDTSAETVAITVASILVDSTAAIQYANLIAAAAVNLSSADSAAPDSRAFQVAKFRVVNQSGINDQVTQVGIRSLNTSDSAVSAVILFRDDNGNGEIDSGTDATIGTGNFSLGFLTLSFLTVDVLDQDSELFMIGYDVPTLVSDAYTLDARVDTVVVASSGGNIANSLNSTPDRRLDVRAIRLSTTPLTASVGTGANVTVTVKAVDTPGNVDIHYSGGTGITWDLTGNAFFVSSTLAGQDIDPLPDPPYDNSQVKGKLVAGVADLTFTDNSEETSTLSVVTALGLTGPHDTGAYVFQQGFLASVLNSDQKLVNPGDTNVVLLAFKISATGVSDSVASITINWQSADSGNVRNVRIFRDMDGNDTFTLAGDTRYGEAASFIGDMDTFVAVYTNDTPYVANGTSRSFFVVADIADTAVGTDTLDVQLLTASITTGGNIPNVPTGIRNSGGYCTVARVPDTFRIGIVSTANRQASEDQTEIIPMTLRFSSPNVADRKFYVETFAIMVEGLSGGVVPNTRIARAQLRNQATSIVYADKVGIESSGDSMVFAIRFDSANPMTVGGLTPETITVDVVLTIAASVTHNDTFRLRVNALDTTWATVWDHPLSTLGVRRQRNNVAVLSPSSLPLLGSIVTVQKKAEVTQQAVRITDLSGNDITYPTTVVQGEQFKVEVGLRATAGRANAQVRSADTDLRFFRNNGATEITSEFAMVSRTHSSLTTITAGTVDTVTYTVAQGAPFSGANETLVINNYLLSDTGPYLQDVNSNADAVKLRVYAVEDAVSTDAVRLDSTYASASVVTLTANNIAPDSKGTRIFGFRVTDGGPRDTITGIRVHLATPSVATMIKSVWIAIDTNKNGVYDSTAAGGDTYFGTVQNFLASDTVFFVDTHRLYGAGDTREFWVCINLETSSITDSTQIQVEIPIDGLGFRGASADQDSIPKTMLTSSVLMRTIIVATRIVASPDTQNISAGAGATITVRAEDTYGNLNIRTTNYAQALINGRIRDTWAVNIDKSARFTGSSLTGQALTGDGGGYYDSNIAGNLTAGVATVNLTDTQQETVAIAFTHATLPGETVTVSFTADPNVTVVALAASSKISPDSTDAVVLQMDVAYPFTLTTVDSIYLVSENTFDTAIKRLRLWVDSDQNGTFSTASDSNIDTASWSAGGCSFLVNRNWVKPAGISSQRLFVTVHMETSPQNDNDSIGCRVDTKGIRLTPGGVFPPTGELDSIGTDTQNAVIDVNAVRTGGRIHIVDPGVQNKDVAFTLTLKALDAHGNHDRIFTTLGSSGAKDITFSASPAAFTFQSTSMTEVTALPAATFTGRFKLATDTITIMPTVADTITLTLDVNTPPPDDTTIGIVVNAGGWSITPLSLPDSQFVASDTGVVVGAAVFRNLDITADTLTRIDIADIGNLVANTDVVGVALWWDSNANGVFDTGVGPLLDSHLVNATFSAVESAAFNITRRFAPSARETYFFVATIAAAPAGSTGDTIGIRFVALTCSTSRAGRIPASNVTHADSLAYFAPSLGDIFGDSLEIPTASYGPGATNIVIGSFSVLNTRTPVDSVTSVTIWNDTGGHPDTGITNVRIYIDGNRNNAYESNQDTLYAAADSFFQRRMVKTGNAKIGTSGETVGLLVLADLSTTKTVDSQVLRAIVETGGILTFQSDTAAAVRLRSNGEARTAINVTLAAVGGRDSNLIAAGTAAVGETVLVTVTVRDTFGNLGQGRLVHLIFLDSGISWVSASPTLVDTRGLASFTITSATAGTYRCSAVIDTNFRISSMAYANFLSMRALFDTAFTNNTQRATNTGAGDKYSAPLSFSRTTVGRAAELRYNNTDYRVYYDHLGAGPTLIWERNSVATISPTQPGPAWTSTARVRSLKGAGADNIVFGAFSSSANYGMNLYYKPWGAAAGANPTRISPNDTRSGAANLLFDTDALFDHFDVFPDGESIVAAFDGQLNIWRAVGATFDPQADSPTFKMVTTLKNPNDSATLTGGYGYGGAYIQYPSVSPDGKRIAFTVVYRDPNWDGAPTGSDSAEIYVLYDLATVEYTPIPFQSFSNVFELPRSKNNNLVRITSTDTHRFAWQPHWSRDGSALFFSANNNANFDYDVFTQTVSPQNALNAAGVDFNMYMVYYDKAAETAPYGAIPIMHEPGISEIAGEMSSDGDSLAYMRTTIAEHYEERTLHVSTHATVSSSGGILFDSGNVIAVIGANNSYGNGFTISVRRPDSSPAGSDSVIISGLAKKFFNPDTPTAPVYFADSIRIFLYYSAAHFNDTDRQGYDSDGDGIPDRTEAAIAAYYWTGTAWVEYPTVRYPAENKIEFFTNHFSIYGAGLPMEARALAFSGSVAEVVAYPNPWRADGATGAMSPADERYGIKLTRMPGPDVRVRVFTLAGEVVADATVNCNNKTSTSPNFRVTAAIINDGNALGTVSWNLANNGGRHVSSGVYLIMLEGPGGRAVRKVAVVR